MKAIWNNQIIAESDQTINIEGNAYFPPESIKKEFFVENETKTVCHWKGEASYYDLKVGGDINQQAAWYYPETKELAKDIKGYIAFWKGVEITK